MIDDNILLVTDEEEIAEKILSKLVLLRESDSIAVCNYKMAKQTLENPSVSVVIIHARDDNQKTLDLIKSIKSPDYDIILLVNNYEQDFILSAYDLGAADYYCVDSEPYEMLIRTVNCFKAHSVKVKAARNLALLKKLGVVDEETGFYKHKYSKDLLTEFIKDRKVQNGMFIVMLLDESCKTRFSGDKLSKAIKQSVRSDDIVSIVTGGKFYMILPNIDRHGAFAVVNKIQSTLGNKLIVRAGVCRIEDKSFERLEKETFAALSEACQTDETAVYLEEKVKTLDEWLDDEKSAKNFKLFQNSYNNKLEKVIAPVFYRLQKAYEEKLFHTKIEQYCDELQSVFQLKSKTGHESRLKIIYPGFAKIVIYITHSGLDSPENREISLNLNEVTQKGFAKIVEDFIKEFKKSVKE